MTIIKLATIQFGVSIIFRIKKDVGVKGYEQSEGTIGNDVWIAANVVILRDIKIGNGAVIGAGAIVTKDIPPYSIVVSNPARVIKKRFDDETIKILKEIQ